MVIVGIPTDNIQRRQCQYYTQSINVILSQQMFRCNLQNVFTLYSINDNQMQFIGSITLNVLSKCQGVTLITQGLSQNDLAPSCDNTCKHWYTAARVCSVFH